MGTITAGVGLISGIDTASIIDQLIALESTPKFRLQTRAAELSAQQQAILDINSKLLAFKTVAAGFRTRNVFQSFLASSTDDEVLGATSTSSAQPGTYKFLVKQLVSTSQFMSSGFATRDETPLGLDQIAFDFGDVRLTRDESLENLNGGGGVQRGKIDITDRAGNEATIDLTDVVSVNEILERINANTDIEVTASVQGSGIVIEDTSGATTSNLIVEDAAGFTTATDLGIAGDVAATTITGTDIYLLGGSTPLKSLNDGTGVLIRSNNPDFTITARDGDQFDIDLGRLDNDIDDNTLLADLNNGDGIDIDDDSDTADIEFVDRDGNEYEIDLTGITTVGALRSRISAQTAGRITLDVHADGNKFTVTDTVGTGTELLKVLGGVSGNAVPNGLGILEEDGVAAATFDGEIVPSTIDQPEAVTLQDVIDRINDAVDGAGDPNAGRIVASIGADGKTLRIQDATGSTVSNLIIASTAANPDAVSDLGIEVDAATTDFTGERLIGGLSSVLVSRLNGGAGLNGATSLTVTDRELDSVTINNIDTFDTLEEIVDELNAQTQPNSVDVTFSLNDAGTGIQAVDTSGGTGNLEIRDDGATALGIAINDATNTVIGSNLQREYVTNATKLADLNYGRGISTGTFKVTDGLGESADVIIGGDEKTVYDLITEINSKGLAINARVNDNGDGILIEEDLPVGETAFVPIKVETVSGATARDLNLIGESSDVEGGFIDGSYEQVVDLDTSDTLEEVIEKINDAGIPVSAGIVNAGSGATPYRLNLSSGLSGARGDLVIDTGQIDLGLSALERGRDAKVFFGSDDPATAFLLTSTDNTLDDVLSGVDITLTGVSEEVVELKIEKNDAAVVGQATQFVTAFNEVVGTLDQYDFFDTDTEQRGLLLGDATVSLVRSGLFRVLTGPALSVDGDYRFLTQVGFGIDGEGQVTLDEAKFRDRFESDPDSMEQLLAAYDVEVQSEEEIATGVTISNTTTVYNSLGVANLFDRLLDDLTDSIDGIVPGREDALQSQIDLVNDRIEQIDQRLVDRRDQLTRQFTAMELAIAQLQSQQSALSSFRPIAISSSNSNS